MTRTVKNFVLIFLLLVVALPLAGAADDHPSERNPRSPGAPGETQRKVKSQVQPVVPEIAKHMNLKGTVRLEIEIGSDGVVKSTRALGGHPVLIQSAEEAIKKWRYEPGPASKTIVEFNFHQE